MSGNYRESQEQWGAAGGQRARVAPSYPPLSIELSTAEQQAANLGRGSDWQQAGKFFIPFGTQWKGRQVLAVARSVDGLLWLAWIHDRMQQRGEHSRFLEALETFFNDQRVQAALCEAQELKRNRTQR